MNMPRILSAALTVLVLALSSLTAACGDMGASGSGTSSSGSSSGGY
ncbi:hypothetical protein [Paraburkholderia gardini]|uniref:Lipoprotein n=1 Tax=Paraburkholderia gardini TaxID=2823469 RepID=A0ABM8U9A6_9BURK|nr:hypothetical protein [Paraburkholderia gardini]CAG4909996.1 hypothetical protein R69919_03748 [Paraburkholderia gardini]CAG4918725.1 hypothetical protein R54767_04538 [Paraburkholderia gardini]